MKKTSVLLVLIMVIGLFAGCSGTPAADGGNTASDDQTYELKISTQLAESHGYVQGFYKIAERVEERTNGKFTIKVLPSGQLGTDEDVIEQALQGVNVAVVTDAGRMANYAPEIGIMGMAYFADDYDQLLEITKTDFFQEQTDNLAKEGIRILSFNFYDGARHFLTKKPITKPEDLTGVRIRTPGAPAWSESVKSLGATPIAMSWSEVYTAMEQKAIDGAESQNSSTYASRVYEVVDYINKTGHFQLINGIIVGEKWFTNIPVEYQEMLIEEFEKAGEEVARETIANDQKFEDLMVEEGVEVIQPDVEAFKAASQAAYEVLDYSKLRQEIYEQIGK